MTATMPERPDLDELTDALNAVLAEHGVPSPAMQVNAIVQGGEFAGLAFSGNWYQRPAGLPAPTGYAPDMTGLFVQLTEIIDETGAVA